MKKPIRVIVVGNEPQKLGMITRQLGFALEVLGYAETLAEAKVLFEEMRPELVLVSHLNLTHNPTMGGAGEMSDHFVEDARQDGYCGVILPWTSDRMIVNILVNAGADDPSQFEIANPAALALQIWKRIRGRQKEAA